MIKALLKASSVCDINTLVSKLRSLEALHIAPCLPPEKLFILRLDGVAFRSYTLLHKFRKPFDERLTKAMIATATDLMYKWSGLCRCTFVISDEICMLMENSAKDNKATTFPYYPPLPFSGRQQKWVSIAAAQASASFNHHILMQSNTQMINDPLKLACFDARVFAVPDSITAMEVFYWRHALDGHRNAINSIIQHSNEKEALGKGNDVKEMFAKLSSQKDQLPFPKENLFGVFIKKELYEHQGQNPRTKETKFTKRSRMVPRTNLDMTKLDLQGCLRLVMARTWNEFHKPREDKSGDDASVSDKVHAVEAT